MDLPARIKVRPSANLVAVLILGHALAVVAMLCLNLYPAFLIPLLLVIGISAAISTRRALLLHDDAPSGIVLGADGHLDIIRRDGSAETLDIGADSFVAPWMVVLSSGKGWRPRTEVLLQDSLGAEGHWALRCWLRQLPAGTGRDKSNPGGRA